MSTGEDNRVLGCRETNHTLSLSVVCDVGRCVVYTVDIVQVEDRIVVLYGRKRLDER